MAQPSTTAAGATTGTLAGARLVTSALLGFITSVDYSVTFGAFAGAICFVVTVSNLTGLQIADYFIFGYAASVFGAGFQADKVENYQDYRENPWTSSRRHHFRYYSSGLFLA